MAILKEKPLEGIWSEPVIGQNVKLQTEGIIVRTSPVVDFTFYANGDVVIKTLHSIYRGTDVPLYYKSLS